MGFEALKTKVSGGEKGSSKIPVVTLTGAEAKTLCEIQDLIAQIKTAETDLAVRKVSLTPCGDRHRVALCHRDQTLHKSVKLSAGDGEHQLTFVRPDNYQKMKAADCKDRLEAMVGDKYDRYFQMQRQVSVKLDGLPTKVVDKLADTIMKVLLSKDSGVSEDKIGEIIKVEEVIKPTETWTHDVVFDAKTAALSVKLQEEGLAIPFAPSFK
jgi:hypothetical protein